ncbi:hypothetical protein EVAR_14122_1 [Eumeta japonica]|uniref:Uncharacterized protein n=1 Tax=Eumeta variegata TaxID=151549 RepID=A0A4C1UNL8_EUMVA|nr:hypothetical protein EVAR_14122_1 [Eumeta japonica]
MRLCGGRRRAADDTPMALEYPTAALPIETLASPPGAGRDEPPAPPHPAPRHPAQPPPPSRAAVLPQVFVTSSPPFAPLSRKCTQHWNVSLVI